MAGQLLRVELFRRHVHRRTEHNPGFGPVVVRQPGDAEIADLERVVLAVVQDVGRLDVPVDHALIVCIVQRLGRAGAEVQRLPRRQYLLRVRELRQRNTRQVFHGVGEAAGGLGFAKKPQACLLEFLVFELFFYRDDFQRHRPVDPGIPGEVHRSHRATPDLAFDHIATQPMGYSLGAFVGEIRGSAAGMSAFHPLQHGLGSLRFRLLLESQRELVHDGGK